MAVSNLGLEECIRNYERENKRKESIESKASYILGITSIFISIWGIFIKYILESEIEVKPFLIALTGLTVYLIAFCGIYSFLVLRIRKYDFPFANFNPNELNIQLSAAEEKLKEELFDSYISSFSTNHLKNDEKEKYLKETSKLLIYSIITSMITLFIFLSGV